MSLKFKRNLPTLLLLMAFLAILGATIGGQSVVAYNIQAQVPALQPFTDSLGQFFGQAVNTLAQTQLSLFTH